MRRISGESSWRVTCPSTVRARCPARACWARTVLEPSITYSRSTDFSSCTQWWMSWRIAAMQLAASARSPRSVMRRWVTSDRPASTPSTANIATTPARMTQPSLMRSSVDMPARPVIGRRGGDLTARCSRAFRAVSAAVGDEVDLDPRAGGQRGDADRRPRRQELAHVLGVDAVERVVLVLEAGEERTGGDDVAQREARALEDDREVVHHAARLGLDVAEDVLAGVGVAGDLTGHEQEVAGAGGVAVRRLVERARRHEAFDHARAFARGARLPAGAKRRRAQSWRRRGRTPRRSARTTDAGPRGRR